MLICLTADTRKKVSHAILAFGLAAAVAMPGVALGEPDTEQVDDQQLEQVVVEEEAPAQEELVTEEQQAEGEQQEAQAEEQAEVPAEAELVTTAEEQPATDAVGLEPQAVKNGWYDLEGHKCTAANIPNGAYWYENDVMFKSKELYDPESDGWYWLDADGTAAFNEDVYVPSDGGKWVHYGANGKMAKGEWCRGEDWYYSDPINGAIFFGWKYLESSGGKWVYYDPANGIMSKGEKYVTGSGGKGWCYFDEVNGAMQTGWKYLKSSGGKWVYYDPINGRMHFGECYVTKDGANGGKGWCLFDSKNGALQYGWKKLGDGRTVFYNRSTGRMVFGVQTIDGKKYRFNEVNGALIGEVPDTPTGDKVFWNTGGVHYHTTKSCSTLTIKDNMKSGTIAQAQAAGKTACPVCAKGNKVYWNAHGVNYHKSNTCSEIDPKYRDTMTSGTVAQAQAAGKSWCAVCKP